MKPITIDEEFKKINRPLTLEELAGLRKSLQEDGCLSPLVVWKEEGILLDGHNRYSICTNLDIAFKVEELSFKTRFDAIAWVVGHQLSRRNSTPEERAFLIGFEYLSMKKSEGRPDKLAQNEPVSGPKTTAEIIAQRHNVSPSTVKRNAKFAEEVQAMNPDERIKVLSGQKVVPKRTKNPAVTDALALAGLAICQLDKIGDDDPKREEAFTKIVSWIEDKRKA